MPNTQLKKEGETKVILTVTVPTEELTPFLEDAAAEISKEVKIDGFRPGKAPYEAIAKKVGEMAVLERALNPIVQKTFVKAVLEHELDTIAAPEINVTTLVPGNDLVYEATVTLVPKIKKLADWKEMSSKKPSVTVTDKEIDQALNDLQDMQRKEVRATSSESVGKTDKVVVDLEMKKDGVPVEGGQSKGSFVFMDQESYLPGLQEALLGMKEGESKTFSLTFPEEHFQKHLAGSEVDVSAAIKEIYHLERPTIDEDLAKSLGFESLQALKDKLSENIGAEKEREEDAKVERVILEDIAEKSEFEEMPANLIESEVGKMLQELHYQVTSQGLGFEAYLSSIKKTAEELKTEFQPQAKRRLEIALLLKAIAKEENVQISREELDALIDARAKDVKDKETRDRIHSPEYREYQENILRNRAVIDLIKTTLLK